MMKNPWKFDWGFAIGSVTWTLGIFSLFLGVFCIAQGNNKLRKARIMEETIVSQHNQIKDLKAQRDSIQIEYYKLLGVKELEK